MRLLDLIFKSKVDRLVAENTRLSMKRQRIEEKTKTKCTSIENKIDSLDSRKDTLTQIKDNEVSNIKRKIQKNEKLIELEIDYNNSLKVKK
jgi:23S rRNA pseudoU1915 N3-methylase RlmH